VNLRAKRLYFEEVLATRDVYEDIRRRTGLLFIPVVVTPEDATWQDTSDIFDALEARVPAPALLPATPLPRVVAYLFELYADEFMLLPAMHYRWSEPAWEADARAAFAAISGDAESAARFAARMRGSLPMLGVTAESVPAIEEHFEALLDALDALLAEQPFLLGGQPSLADCAMMGPFYAHLYLDLAPGQIVRARSPHVAHWIERCNHPAPRTFTGFLPDDALHPALAPVLELIGRDAAPFVLDAARAFDDWADAHPPDLDAPPRAVGRHETALRGRRFARYTSSYLPWLLQRPLDAWSALDEAVRRSVVSALEGTGCETLLAHEPRHRLAKRDHAIVFDAPG
jgi:glutathione S-transferase